MQDKHLYFFKTTDKAGTKALPMNFITRISIQVILGEGWGEKSIIKIWDNEDVPKMEKMHKQSPCLEDLLTMDRTHPQLDSF